MSSLLPYIGAFLGGGLTDFLARSMTAKNSWNSTVLHALIEDKKSLEDRVTKLETKVFSLQSELTSARILLAKNGIESA